MKFIVSKTSLWDDDEPPCQEAFRGKCLRVDCRSVDSPKKLNCMTEDEWYAEGTNHRTEDDYICRDMDEIDCWFIKINSLKQLTKFIDEYGGVVIEPWWNNWSVLKIEIYDTYRE